MKYMKRFGLVAVAVTALTAFAAAGASATTLELAGVPQNKAVTISASLKAGTSMVLSRTDGSLANTCTTASGHGTTVSPFTGATVTGTNSSSSLSNCERPVTVHKMGTIHVAHIGSTTNGTLSSSGAEVTVGSPFGTLNCKTGAGVNLGTLTGVKEGNATVHVNAVVNCGFLVPSASVKSTWSVTPAGLGVVA